MASKRLGSPSEDPAATNKKPRLEIQPVKAFCGISDITPQTATHPQESGIPAALNAPTNNANATAPATTRRWDGSLYEVWVVIELWRPTDPAPEEKPMVKILGVFTNSAVAIEHAGEHVRALRTVTTYGVRDEPEEKDDRASRDMSPASVFERKLEYFRDMYETDDEEDREDGGKHWTVRWGHVTEVWVEKREVYDDKDAAGYFTPLPIVGEDDRD